jgi:hypothetical protein
MRVPLYSLLEALFFKPLRLSKKKFGLDFCGDIIFLEKSLWKQYGRGRGVQFHQSMVFVVLKSCSLRVSGV